MKITKEKKRKKVRVKSYGRLSVFLLLLLVLAVVLLINSSIFELSSISVMGNNRFATQDIIDKAGVSIGTNVFEISESDIKARLEENPYIEVLDVVRDFPDKMTIYVSEREAKVQFECSGTYCIADYNGILLATTSTHNPSLLLVKGMPRSGEGPGKTIATQEERVFNDYLELIKQLKGYTLINEVVTIDLSDRLDFTLSMKNGLIVKLGTPVQLDGKLAYYAPALHSLQKNGYADQMGKINGVLDLSVIDSFAFLPIKEQENGGQENNGQESNDQENNGQDNNGSQNIIPSEDNAQED